MIKKNIVYISSLLVVGSLFVGCTKQSTVVEEQPSAEEYQQSMELREVEGADTPSQAAEASLEGADASLNDTQADDFSMDELSDDQLGL